MPAWLALAVLDAASHGAPTCWRDAHVPVPGAVRLLAPDQPITVHGRLPRRGWRARLGGEWPSHRPVARPVTTVTSLLPQCPADEMLVRLKGVSVALMHVDGVWQVAAHGLQALVLTDANGEPWAANRELAFRHLWACESSSLTWQRREATSCG